MTAVDTHLLLRAFVDELARCGMRTAVTAPGSRNTPLIEALVAEPRITSWSQIDERAAGFFALGAAKAAGRPVAVTVTSGTAVANLLPAVVEAHEARVPLILLTADRPAELRQIGAGQTIDQVKIFGDAVRWYAEPDLDAATPARMRWIRALACRAYFTALGDRPGPVHLNIPLREPLAVDHELPADPPGGAGRPGGAPWVAFASPASAHAGATANPPLPRASRAAPVLDLGFERAVFVAGELDPARPELGDRLAAVAEQAGVPLLADPLSGARRGAAAVAHYDLLLRDPGTLALLTPTSVWRFGELPTSKPLRAWLESLDDAVHVGFARDDSFSDPASRLALRSARPLAGLLEDLDAATDTHPPAPATWLAAWRAADARVAAAIAPALGTLNEPAVSAALATGLPPEAILFVAASMPIRDVETFFGVTDPPPAVLANRGANGIDGTVSTAFGVAAVSDRPVVLLIGDVALAHDIGGLLAAKRHRLKLTIVLVNNDGGAIFDSLAIADGHEPAFTDHVATPHGLDFRHAAALYGLAHVTPTDVGGFMAALNRALQGSASTIVEVRTDRAANRRLHAQIAEAALQALSLPGRAAAPPA